MVKKATNMSDEPSALGHPLDLVKAAFATRLRDAMKRRGWKQADLWRESGIPSRAVIHTYLSERSLPTPENLEKLARALKMEPAKLLPHSVEKTTAAAPAPFSLRALPDGKKGWLQINRLVPLKDGLRIAQIIAEIEESEAASGE